MMVPSASFRAWTSFRVETTNRKAPSFTSNAGLATARNRGGDLPKGGYNTWTTRNGGSVATTTVPGTGGRNWPRGGIGTTIQNSAGASSVTTGNGGPIVIEKGSRVVVGSHSPIVGGNGSSVVVGSYNSVGGGNAGSSCPYTANVFSLEAAVVADINAIVAALQANGGPASASLQSLIRQLLSDMNAAGLAVGTSSSSSGGDFGASFIYSIEVGIEAVAITAALQQANAGPAPTSLQPSIQQLETGANVLTSLISAVGC
jgi:hypothetical protein